MSKKAFLFPGQGAQKIGMGQSFYEADADARAVFEEASEILGYDMKALCFEENEKLNLTPPQRRERRGARQWLCRCRATRR